MVGCAQLILREVSMNVLSLFDGMSNGRIALERAGVVVDSYYASEVDKWAMKVSADNWLDITQLGDVTQWREWDIDWMSLDLLIGGSPCQGFSYAGKQLAFDDPRSALFFVYVDILNHIKEVNPNVKFLLENVKMKQEYLDVISTQLGVKPVFINSSLVSAQNRQRYYWANWEFEVPEDKGISLHTILEEVVDDNYYHTDKAVDYMNRVGSTGRVKWAYSFHSEERKGKSACVTANFLKGVPNNVLVCGRVVGRRINRKTKKRADYDKSITPIQIFEPRYDKKTGALTTVQKDNELGINEGVSIRKFTPVECERLQTVPDNYTACVSKTQRYKMLGNGWTVDVIAHIFKGLTGGR